MSCDLECVREGRYRQRQCLERIGIFSLFRNFGKSETREVRRDHAIMTSETWNEFAEHERRCREPMQQEHHRRVRVPRLSVKNLDTIRFDLAYGRGRHLEQDLSGTGKHLCCKILTHKLPPRLSSLRTVPSYVESARVLPYGFRAQRV